jgi:hypothetical protein
MIEDLIIVELAYANEKHGEKFHSPHECYAVIKEEVEEVEEEFKQIKIKLECMWGFIKEDETDSCGMQYEMEYMKDATINLIKEAIQVAAMIEKYERSFGEEVK